jgi:uncharacterized membrane protein YbaN (DUF454 family)
MITKYLWRAAGLFSVGMAYVGVLLPGIPTTSFLLLALWCFGKSSPTLQKWILEHPTFGPYVVNWSQKRIYPTKAKWMMLICCSGSYIWLIYIALSPIALISIGAFMLFWLIWAWRYPGSIEEYNYRVAEGKKIGWFK